MNKYKSDDYKLSAVKYYLNNNDSLDKVCSIFDCKKSTLKGWVDRYKTTKNITRKNRKPISYKINKDQVKTAVNMIDKNEQLTIDELLFAMKQKYKDLDISTRHLGRVVRANNPNALKEFGGTLDLTDRWARDVLTKLEWRKRKGTTGKVEPSPQFL